ncbi:MAG: hypothetical protein QXK93_04775 [Candidatus Bathyarchaeia archaeon]
MQKTMMCPFHLKTLVFTGKHWKCPVEGCIYKRAPCPTCGFIIRILPSGSFCLGCGQRFTYNEVVEIYAKAFELTHEEAKKQVDAIMSHY